METRESQMIGEILDVARELYPEAPAEKMKKFTLSIEELAQRGRYLFDTIGISSAAWAYLGDLNLATELGLRVAQDFPELDEETVARAAATGE